MHASSGPSPFVFFEMANIFGTRDNDLLLTTSGSDNVLGNLGNDTIRASNGNDTLQGGDGYDIVSYETFTAPITLNAFGSVAKQGGASRDQLNSIEKVVGSQSLSDQIDTSAATPFGRAVDVNLAQGRINVLGTALGFDVAGFENVIGTGNNDTIIGDRQANRLELGNGSDFADGGANNDIIIGGFGNDTMAGGSGDDVLIGGEGRDRLSGGDGNDIFRFETVQESPNSGGNDVITDFLRSDKIDLSRIDTNPATGVDDRFSWRGLWSNPSTLPAGSLGYAPGPGGITLFGNVGSSSNDTTLDLRIDLPGVQFLTASDIIL